MAPPALGVPSAFIGCGQEGPCSRRRARRSRASPAAAAPSAAAPTGGGGEGDVAEDVGLVARPRPTSGAGCRSSRSTGWAWAGARERAASASDQAEIRIIEVLPAGLAPVSARDGVRRGQAVKRGRELDSPRSQVLEQKWNKRSPQSHVRFSRRALAALRAKIAAIEAGGRADSESLPFGDARIDGCLPGGGLPLGRWHEIVGEGLEVETAAAPAAFAALLAAPLAAAGRGGLGAAARRPLRAGPGRPGLSGRAADPGLRPRRGRGPGGDGGRAGHRRASPPCSARWRPCDLTAGRRLQLACEKRGATGFVIRRRPYRRAGQARGDRLGGGHPLAGRLGALASRRPASSAWARRAWRVALERCRGGRTGAWLFEAADAYTWEKTDGAHPLRLVADLGDRQLAPAQPLRLAG